MLKIQVNVVCTCTSIDGKNVKALVGTLSTQTCQACDLTPKRFQEYDDLKQAGKIVLNPKALSFGISPLHLFIRLYEFFLNLGYRGEYHAYRLTVIEKQKVAERTQKIRDAMKMELGILVSVPLPGGKGNSNNGNAARKAFRNHTKFAEIIGVDPELIRRVYVLICAMNQPSEVDPDKYDSYAKVTDELFVSQYGKWRNWSVTGHKLVKHGGDYLRALPLPPGMLSEQAQESQNKYLRYSR